MRVEELKRARILVVGAGLSGASVARFLVRHGLGLDLVDEAGVPEPLARLVASSAAANGGGRVHGRLDATLVRRFDVVVISPGVPRAHPAIAAALGSGVRVVGDVELFASRARAPIVAVTGSNGKSTVVAWLTEVLRALDVRAVACGNIGLPVLDSLDDDVACHVLELSSYQLESTESLAPAVATVLNVSEDHLDRYDSLADYAAAKRRVHARAARIVVNADDPASAPRPPVAGRVSGRFTARPHDAARMAGDETGRGSGAGGTLWHLADGADGGRLCRDGSALLERATLALPGAHNAVNALAVLALLEGVAAPLGLAPEVAPGATALAALAAFRGLPHRTELVGEAGGVRWYDDSKGTNVDACAKALAAMPGPVVLIAGGLAKDADFAPLRPLVERHARAVVLIGRDRERLAAAFDGAVELHRRDSLEEAVSLAGTLARRGDAVLLSPACASFDMFSGFEERGRRFAECVRERHGGAEAASAASAAAPSGRGARVSPRGPARRPGKPDVQARTPLEESARAGLVGVRAGRFTAFAGGMRT